MIRVHIKVGKIREVLDKYLLGELENSLVIPKICTEKQQTG
jgi:hypothetical protein